MSQYIVVHVSLRGLYEATADLIDAPVQTGTRLLPH